MKKFSSTWILFVLVLVLGGYTYFFEIYKKDHDEKRKTEESKIFSLSKDQVSSITVQNSKEKMALERSVDGWEIKEPIKDIADNESIESFIGSLLDERTKEMIKEGDGSDDKAYGFGPDSSIISLKSTTGALEEVEVSAEKNFEGNPFLRMKNQKKIFVASPSWLSYAGKNSSDFRDKRFLRARIAEAEEIEFQNPKGTTKLISKDGKWQNSNIATELLDQNRIREVLSVISDLKAQEVLSSDLRDKEKNGLQAPTVKIKMKLKVKGEDKTWLAELALSKDKSFAIASNSFPGHIVKIDKASFDRFNEVSLLTLRDTRWPFSFDKTQVKKISLKSPAKKSKLALNGADWALEPADPNVEVQQTQVKDLIDRLKTFEASHFLPKNEMTTFKDENQIRLDDGEGKLIFEFLWGPLLKKKFNGIEQNIRYAKTSRSDETFAIEESNFGRLGLQNLTKTKEKP